MPRTDRHGYTLFELVCVLALIIILGGAIVPSMTGLYGNTHQRAAADILVTRLAEARGKAMEHGKPYRVAVNGDKLRVAPDGDDFGTMQPPEGEAMLAVATEDTLEKATITLTAGVAGGTLPDPDASGWQTVATFLPDGTCRETGAVVVEVREKDRDFPPIRLQVRGVTGATRTLPPDAANAGAKP
jgi:Tfp pilus assembly protein FimT